MGGHQTPVQSGHRPLAHRREGQPAVANRLEGTWGRLGAVAAEWTIPPPPPPGGWGPERLVGTPPPPSPSSTAPALRGPRFIAIPASGTRRRGRKGTWERGSGRLEGPDVVFGL